jgi:hypothetical protein
MKNNIHRQKYTIGNAMKIKNFAWDFNKTAKKHKVHKPLQHVPESKCHHSKPRVPIQKLNTGFVLAPTSWRKLPWAALERRERPFAAKLLQHS